MKKADTRKYSCTAEECKKPAAAAAPKTTGCATCRKELAELEAEGAEADLISKVRASAEGELHNRQGCPFRKCTGCGGYGHDRKSCPSFRSVEDIPRENLPVLYDKLGQPGAPPYADLFAGEIRTASQRSSRRAETGRHG